MNRGDPDPSEAERQLGAAVARYREAVAALDQGGRSAAGDATAAGAMARGAALVAYTLQRAHGAGMGMDRMAAVSGWDPDVIREVLAGSERPALTRAIASGVDTATMSGATETLAAVARVDELLGRISADLVAAAWSPEPAELDDLRDGLERQWRAWRDTHHGAA